LATVVGPYYSGSSSSLTSEFLLDITRRQFPRGGKGILLLLDEPYPDPWAVDRQELLEQTFMLQQSCDLQAAAVVDFIIQEKWVDLTVVASGDDCGGLSLQLIDRTLKDRGLDCHFKITYLQERTIEVLETTTQTEKLLKPNYISSEARSVSVDAEFYNKLFESQHIVFLSSIPFANKVLDQFTERIQGNPSFMFGDFWGDPTNARDLYNNIRELDGLGLTLFVLRASVNGTDVFNEYFSSIEFNSTAYNRNTFLSAYWPEASKCGPGNMAGSNCQLLDSLAPIIRPILRNYKAPLIMDIVHGLAEYIVEYSNQFGEAPNTFTLDSVSMGEGVIEIFNNFTGNTWKFGLPDDGNEPNWIQPLEWRYDILSGKAFEELYGSWDVNASGLRNKSGVLTIFKATLSPNYTHCDHSEIDCDASSLYSMTALIVIILVLLLVVVIIYICSGVRDIAVAGQFIKSPGKVIFGLDILLSFCISFWVIFGDEALDCESRADDFLVTLTNSLCYTILIGYLLTYHIDNNMAQFCMQVCGSGVLVAVQIAISAVAHFDIDNEENINLIQYCYSERNKAIVAVSYWYSGVLLLGCVLLLLYNLFSTSGRFRKLGLLLKVVIGFVALIVGAVYITCLSVVIWVDDQEFCLSHGRFFIILALYPAIVCLLAVTILLLTQIWKQKKIGSLEHVKELDRRPPTQQSHIYVFEGFPELTTKMKAIELDDDITREIDDVLIEPQRIQIKLNIGSGNFGKVFKAVLDGGTSIAVKSIQDVTSARDVNDFIREGLQMKNFHHPNVMELLGICWVKDSKAEVRPCTPLLVLPYMELGDLKKFLRKNRPNQGHSGKVASLGLAQLVKFGHQIARGMVYLSEQGIVHRDLAARNCMVNFDLEIKVSDFGLSRSMEGKGYYRMGTVIRLPVKWMAPESLIDQVFTTKSDVWSYGVTLWEVMSLAQSPYPGVDNQDILVYLKQGKRLIKPDECPQSIYDVMSKCWLQIPHHRPTFSDLVGEIEEYLEELMNYFDPTVGGESRPDPYINWQLLKSSEEEEAKEARDHMHVQSSDNKQHLVHNHVPGNDNAVKG
jgi:serine/threonine protein kinase/NADH:ubiquinone oxidoreductase subunit 6 (subunit J)